MGDGRRLMERIAVMIAAMFITLAILMTLAVLAVVVIQMAQVAMR